MLQASSAAPTQIYAALRDSALPMSGTTPNFSSGYGFIQADAALARLAPGAPTLTLAATSVVVGNSTTISWSDVGATSCTASGSWSGTLATSGTQTLAPTTAGTSVYSLTCANAAGPSAASKATLTATAATTTTSNNSGGGGGGGDLDGVTLLGLAALTVLRLVRGRVSRTREPIPAARPRGVRMRPH